MNAKKLIKALGGLENIDSFTSCMTRLRFNLRDLSLLDEEQAKEIDSVIGVQIRGGQAQVITQGSVDKHFADVKKYIDESEVDIEELSFVDVDKKEKIEAKPKFGIDTIMNHLGAILSPAIPVIAGGGLLKAFYFALTTFDIVAADSSVAFVLNMLSDMMFFYLPFFLAYTAAQRFKTNVPLALSLAGLLMYPSFMDLAAEGGKLSILGIPILVANYKSSVIPIILSVWFMSKVHEGAKKVVPEALAIAVVPLVTITIAGLASLIVFAPIGFYLAEYVSVFMQKVITLSPFVSGFIIGGTRPLLVLTGMHHVLSPITLQQLDMYGETAIGAISLFSTFAQASAALAFWMFSKDKKDKQLGASTAVTGYIGITEPILFGILVPNRDLLYITMFSGGLAAGIGTTLGATAKGFVMPGILSLPAFMGDGFIGIIVGIIVAIVTTVGLYGIRTKMRRDKK